MITITINRDGIWGDTDLDSINVDASEAKLAQMVANAVAEEYGVDVEANVSDVMDTKVSGVDDDDDRENIRNIESGVWQTWAWVVDAG